MTSKALNNRRALLVMRSLNVGGTERQVAILAAGLRARSWSVDVFSIDGSGPLREELVASGVAVLDGGLRAGRSLVATSAQLLGCEFRLLRHIVATRPRVVHSFLPLPNFLGSFAGWVLRTPLVITSKRALATHQDRYPAAALIDRIANFLSHYVTANAAAIAVDTERRDGYPAARVVIVPNALDFRAFTDAGDVRAEMRARLNLSDCDVAAVCVANLIPYKGHSELITALAMLADEHPTLKLFLIGDDRGIGADLMAQTLRLGVASRVFVLGQRQDVASVLTAMDLGVLPSHEEGLSNALIEKLAAGLPVVATAVGGNPSVVEGMPGCRLVRAHDAEDLVRGLREVLMTKQTKVDADHRRQLVGQRYSVEVMVNAYEAIYLKS